MDYRFFIIPAVILLPVTMLVILLHFKKKTVIKKVKSLNSCEKEKLLNTLAGPVGFFYEPRQDIFTSETDAPQKIFGYTTLYDLSAPYFNMVFDYETIYFNYNARTWLIELWKGQYGINTGCELGIYYTDKIISPDKYNSTLFRAADTKDMPDISLSLSRSCPNPSHQSRSCQNRSRQSRNCCSDKLGRMHGRHWWLTVFKMGTFTNPKNVCVDASIHFKDYTMMYRFLDSFRKTLPDTSYQTIGTSVLFPFYQSSRKYSFFKRVVRRIALTACCLYCKWFHYITRPFLNSGDRLLYLYYYLPSAARLMLKPKFKSERKAGGNLHEL